MLKVSHSLPDIAVLRGGNKDFKSSLIEGAEVLTSLVKIGYSPLDVLIDRDGNWTNKGAPTDAHSIFTRSHTVVDTTRMRGEHYQALAKRMNIPLLFSVENEVILDREDMYRVLRQQGIRVPATKVVRASTPLEDSLFRELWSKYHTPLLVRPLVRQESVPSRLIKLYSDLEKVIREYHTMGVDVQVLTYKKTHTTSIAALPSFRKEKVYTPLWVDTFPQLDEIPNSGSPARPHFQAPEFRKDAIKLFATKVCEALSVTRPVCIDFISHNNELIVVNVDFEPSLRKDGRFMQSLHTTGVDAGHYVHSCIHNDVNR